MAIHEKAGRPKANLDWDKIDELLEAGCHGTEIAAYFGVDRTTLYNRCQSDKNSDFSTYSAQKKEKGVSLIRAKQHEVALAGDKTMLIWVGKQRAGQKEKQEVEHTMIEKENEITQE